MAKRQQSTLGGATGRLLYTEKFVALANTLREWRLDDDIQRMDAEREKGRILGFVKGLRLSSQLAYIVRDIVSGDDAHVSWGHLVDSSGKLCSPECDIIIHRPGWIQRWNGGEHPIMDFRFVDCSKAIAVISCKSFAKAVDKEYYKQFAAYGLKHIVLFAECCFSDKVAALRKQAREAGYTGFYYLYTMDSDNFTERTDPAVYGEFIRAVKKVVSVSSNGKPIVRRKKKPAKR